jgi:hypothetical protein
MVVGLPGFEPGAIGPEPTRLPSYPTDPWDKGGTDIGIKNLSASLPFLFCLVYILPALFLSIHIQR